MHRRNQKGYILQAQKLWSKLASSFLTNFSRFKRSKSLKRIKTVLGGKRSRFIHARRIHRHVYVDELYIQPVAPASVDFGEMTPQEMKKEKVIKKREAKDDDNAFGLKSRGAIWEMEEVDVRAEMFINKFKEEMRLQRQRSFKEYQEMLARSI